jgi:ATP-binding protein involved in chromosome partitioning
MDRGAIVSDLKIDQIKKSVQAVLEPSTGYTLGELQAVSVQYQDNTCQLTLTLPFVLDQSLLERRIRDAMAPWLAETTVVFHWRQQCYARVAQKHQPSHRDIKNMIAVVSGKGGVGKSTVAVNLALSLQKQGACVGLLDADIYGPSQAMLLGVGQQRPESLDGKIMEPIRRYGLQTMSMGYLLGPNTPTIWRGPMVSMALQQLLSETRWQALDYLIVDLPPGTGDIQLTMAQKLPITGAVVVTTPQDLALLDVRRAVEMLHKVEVAVLGVVENMSYHQCSQCQQQDFVFGEGGAAALSAEYQVPCLGQLPLDRCVHAHTQQGCPTVEADPTCAISETYGKIARRVAAGLALRPRSYTAQLPGVEVKHCDKG